MSGNKTCLVTGATGFLGAHLCKKFKNLGYDLELNKLVDKKIINNELRYITKSSHENKIIPNFLIDKDYNEENLNILIDGLNLINSYLEKTILKPNNLSQPISRINFLNTLK